MLRYNIGSIYSIQHFIPIQEDENLEFLGQAQCCQCLCGFLERSEGCPEWSGVLGSIGDF